MNTYWLLALTAFPIIATAIVGEAKQTAPIDTIDILVIALFSLIFAALWPAAVVIAIATVAVRLIVDRVTDGSDAP